MFSDSAADRVSDASHVIIDAGHALLPLPHLALPVDFHFGAGFTALFARILDGARHLRHGCQRPL